MNRSLTDTHNRQIIYRYTLQTDYLRKGLNRIKNIQTNNRYINRSSKDIKTDISVDSSTVPS